MRIDESRKVLRLESDHALLLAVGRRAERATALRRSRIFDVYERRTDEIPAHYRAAGRCAAGPALSYRVTRDPA
jgi:hypothetical protein